MKKGTLIKRGNVWHAVWHEDGKQRWKSTGKTRRADAADWMADMLAPLNAADKAKALRDAADAADRDAAAETGRRMRVADAWAFYTAAPERSDAGDGTMTGYRAIWRTFTAWLAGRAGTETTVADITHTVASDYAAYLTKKTGHTTYNKHLQFLRLMWKTIGKATGGTANPWLNIAKRRSPVESRRELTVEEVGALAKAAAERGPEWNLLFAVGVYTGMRLTDCATLQWSEIDLAAGLIRKTARKTARSTGKVLVIPIHKGLRAALLQAHPNHGRHVMPKIARRALVKSNALTYAVSQIFDAAGIQRQSEAVAKDRIRPTILAGFHSLRHTFVSVCRKANVPLAVVESIVGHSNAAMTRHYTHIGDAAAVQAIAALPMIGQSSPAAPEQAPLPGWAADRLRAMTAADWSEIRDGILAAAAQPAVQNV